MNIVYERPQVEVMHSFDGRKDAWILSRPNIHNVEDTPIEEIESMDLPLLGARVYQLHLRTSILFRDLFLTLRPLPGAWARSLRINPLSADEVTLSVESYHPCADRMMVEEYFLLLEKGHTLDYSKSHLPMSVMTDYSVVVDDRTLVAFLRCMKDHFRALYNFYGDIILTAIGMTEERMMARNVSDIYDRYALSMEETNSYGQPVKYLGDQVFGSWVLPSNIMAQFVRQSYASVKNGLWNLLAAKPDTIPALACDHPIQVALYTNRQAFLRTAANRSCTVAKWDKRDDGWGPVTESVLKGMTPAEFLRFLPCHGCYDGCPFKGDLNARVSLEDVGMPCPIQCEDPRLVYKRLRRYGADSYTATMWQMLANSGLIADNPDNEHRKQYEENLRKAGLDDE